MLVDLPRMAGAERQLKQRAGLNRRTRAHARRDLMRGVQDRLSRDAGISRHQRAHLLDLARAAHPTPARPRRRQTKHGVWPAVQWTLDAITGAAAFVGNDRLDILAANQL
jgi:hypothetical protein